MYRNGLKVIKFSVYVVVVTLLNLVIYKNFKRNDGFVANSIQARFGLQDIIINSSLAPRILLDGYVDSLDELIKGYTTPLALVKSPSEDAINVGFILVNIKKTKKLDYKLETSTKNNLRSLLKYAKSRPLHFILVTDEFSSGQVGNIVASLIGHKLSQNVIQNVYSHKLVQPPKVTIVDYKEIVAAKPEFVHGFMALNVTDAGTKYEHEFFFIAPIYHLAFTSLDRMIVIDGTDLDFRSDIAELDDQFKEFAPGNIIGMGNDMSPYYWLHLEKYRIENPSTELGNPGPTQGLNSGVVLFDFDKMRKSKTYNEFLEPNNTKQLLNKHYFRAILGDQDWFTNLNFVNPDLYYVLPCHFNSQTSLEYMRAELLPLFDEFHFCDIYQNLKIVHYNGCGMTPALCGHKGDPTQHMSQMYKKGAYDLKVVTDSVNWMFFVKKQVERGELKPSVLL